MKDKTLDDFLKYFEVSDVVERELEIMGEASNKISIKFKNENPEYDWRQMKDLRNRVIHNYDGLDPYTIYKVVRTHLPSIKEKLDSLGLPAIPIPVLRTKAITKADLLPKRDRRNSKGRGLL